jgi:hypothetical protein
VPTILVCILEPYSGAGVEGAWTVSIAQEETLAKVLERVDPDLTSTPDSATAPEGGGGVEVVSRVFGAQERLRGLVLTSDRAVRWALLVGGVEKAVFRTEAGAPACTVILPGSLGAGATVAVQALNESDQGDASCNAALLWYTRST